MINGEYAAFWDNANLLRYDQAVVDTLLISDEAKRFLVDLGLPKSGSYYFPLAAQDPGLPFVVSVCFNARRIPRAFKHLRLLGTRHISIERPVHYGISEDRGGVVYAIRDNSEGPVDVHFASSSVIQYADIVTRLERWFKWAYGDKAVNENLDGMEEAHKVVAELRSIDPAACDVITASGMRSEFGEVVGSLDETGQF